MIGIWAAIRKMRELGMDAEGILAVVESMETSVHVDGPAAAVLAKEAARLARDRNRKREKAAQNSMENSAEFFGKSGQKVPPKELIKTPSKPSLRSGDIPARDAFAEFWKIYPKRHSEKPARDKFLAIVRKGTAPEVILAGAQRYAAYTAGTEARFVKNAIVWLNHESWNDEYDMAARQSTGPPRSRNRKTTVTDMLREEFHERDYGHEPTTNATSAASAPAAGSHRLSGEPVAARPAGNVLDLRPTRSGWG